ncbi:hypothetical protein LIX60_11245 [Streptomyces sp. S07_1.15]|uniref:hypothetical protein n=1 Tax=Streptomyces sp. S07_1.15 TaxID=2873925 RepID=UPI001D15C43C|nr:hypothetical protein [Streptomyces sp. S07_1.15]MCC3652031.1 hypothetical protein [Streptomyces sp. S07_1.15]
MDTARIITFVVVGLIVAAWLRRTRDEDGLNLAASGTGAPMSPRAAELGLLPAEQQDTERPGPRPELTPVLAAAAEGDWQPAAALLAGTGTDWERRLMYTGELAQAAVRDDTWLRAWRTARPDDPGAALVQADTTTKLAWEVRGAHVAQHTTAQQFEGFHDLLMRSREQIAHAAALAPEDPSPHVVELWTALGLGYSHGHLRSLWSLITERAPHHYAAHYAALQYWCAKWRGSEDLAREFAARAAASAPRGSLLTLLPLIWWYEHKDDDARSGDYRTAALIAQVDTALEDVAAAPADHPRLPEARHLLAWFLVKQKRHTAALEQFLLVDGYVDALPWRYHLHPQAVYCAAREIAVRGTRKETLKARRPQS